MSVTVTRLHDVAQFRRQSSSRRTRNSRW